MKWGHDQLAEDLASHLRGTSDRVVWTDMQLGPSGSPRPDVYTIPKSFTKFAPLAYECKISVADFRRDVTSGKWQSYLKFAAGVVFAVPAGLIKKEDVPPGCGLIVRHDEIWRTVKGPTLKHVENLPRDAWLKLMIDGLDRQAAREHQPRQLNKYRAAEEISKTYGEGIAKALRDRDTAEAYLRMEQEKAKRTTEELREQENERVKVARQHVERELGEIKAARTELAVALGLHPDAGIWQIQSAAREARNRLLADGEIERLQTQFRKMKEVIDSGLKPLPAIAE